jgi:hypothetical protein
MIILVNRGDMKTGGEHSLPAHEYERKDTAMVAHMAVPRRCPPR